MNFIEISDISLPTSKDLPIEQEKRLEEALPLQLSIGKEIQELKENDNEVTIIEALPVVESQTQAQGNGQGLLLSTPQKKQKKKPSSNANNENSVAGRWNKEEHDKFIEAIKKYGKDWKQVEQHIESRTGAQIRSHAQKFFNRLIKKYGIEKNNVIEFVNNAYNSNFDSSLHSPKHRKKGIPAEGDDPFKNPILEQKQMKKSLYVFNEEPDINVSARSGVEGFVGSKDPQRDYIEYSGLSETDMTKKGLAWRDHIKNIMQFSQEVYSDLLKDESLGKTNSKKKLKYDSFLSDFNKKLDLLNNSELVRVGRPHSNSEDNICTNGRKFHPLEDLLQLRGPPVETVPEREPFDSSNFGPEQTSQKAWQGVGRKFSFQLPDDPEENRTFQGNFSNYAFPGPGTQTNFAGGGYESSNKEAPGLAEDFAEIYVGRKRQNSMDV